MFSGVGGCLKQSAAVFSARVPAAAQVAILFPAGTLPRTAAPRSPRRRFAARQGYGLRSPLLLEKAAQVQWQQNQVEEEDREQPIERTIADERDYC
jgi:hypothetical protein